MKTTSAERMERPCKVGLGYVLGKHGEVRTFNRASVERYAENLARRETTRTRYPWHPSVFDNGVYFRVSLCGQKEAR